ncbi:SNF2 family N-terminal domain-containing protein [Lasiosphaeria hispida]|uniref:DNA helicase n=1 Tax=Lasiosphaeria hispida TaxID=260671 RepID=A0AAJ0MA91_9PEZI|nr:SNF2 family N-terminal domain-containing protein [Lasiosphaeria hispida]
MTEIASPDPTHADSAAPNDENDNLATGPENAHDSHTADSRDPDPPSTPNPASSSPLSRGPSPEPSSPEQQSPALQSSSSRPHGSGINGANGINGHAPESDAMDDGPPAKRRRVRETTPGSSSRPGRPKPESPPWKKIEAEGPSTFVAQDGRRKSGRINTVPLELHRGDKRITRRSLHGQQPSPPKNRFASTNGHASNSPANHSTPSSATSAPKRPLSSGKNIPPKSLPTKSSSRRPAPPQDVKPTSTRSRRRSASPKRLTTPTKPSAGTRRSTRRGRDTYDEDDNGSPGAIRTTPRIKLRVRPPLTVIPLVHRDQANLRPKLGPTFEEYFDRAANIPVEEGGLLTADDGPQYTEEMARQDAQIILRVEKEVQPGGLLAVDRCSIFEPEPQEEPPRQYAHMDHLTKAMANFRKLMLIEHHRHRAAAKRLAIACEAEWKRRNPQPKTEEELEHEELEKTRIRWRQVNRAIAGTWDNVKVEINRRRVAEWEAEEQRRVKAALNQAVNLSEQKLQARQAQQDAEDAEDLTGVTDDDDDDDMVSDLDDNPMSNQDFGEHSEDALGADESNMSSSDDDEDKDSVLSDEGLTQEQLREKYANLPGLDPEADGEEVAVTSGEKGDGAVNGDLQEGDTTDESIDMDDDPGSDDDEDVMDDEDDSDGSDGEEESEDDESSGLLGLFFEKSELKQLKSEATEEITNDDNTGDVDMADVDEPTETRDEPCEDTNTAGAEQDESSRKSLCAMERPLTKSDGNGDVASKLRLATRDPVPVKDGESEMTLVNPVVETGMQETINNQPPALVNGAPILVNHSAPDQAVSEPLEDVSMLDGPAMDDTSHQGIPEVEITEVSINGRENSPETDAVTNPRSPCRSLSPRASDDTKPSEVETPTASSLLNVPKTDSRSTSPQPVVPRTEIPFLLRGTLREYQHLGLDWLSALYVNSTNGILADEMGLGKTIQTIALLAHLACHHEVWGPHLVIVPTSVMLNWEMEFKKWCPGFKILTYYGNQDERKRKRQGWTNDDVWNVCITSYQMVLQDQQVFRRRRWHYMILDEAHNIKNFKSQRWQTLLGFNTHSRLLLTGTPLQNNLTELWSLLYFLAPPENGEGGFVDLSEFHNWFSRPESQILESGREQLDDEARAIISKLHKVLRPYLLRRLKADVEKQMPAKYEHVEFCRLSKRQRELYDGFLSRADTRQTLASGNYMSIINCLMQLRKVCNHPDLFVDRPIMTSFRMQHSVPADYELKELTVRRLSAEKPMSTVSLGFLNMIPTQYEGMSNTHAERVVQLSSHRTLLDLREAQKTRANNAYTTLDPASVKSNIVYLESAARWGRFEELQHHVYLNALRRQQRPIYGKRVVELLTFDLERRPYKQRPKIPAKLMSWFEEDSHLLHSAIPTLQQRAGSMETIISKFACVTPAVVTSDLNKFLLGERGIEAFQETDLKLSAPVKYAPYMPKEPPQDPWHEARMRLSIQFPDKRLLQYDCGKLQALDKLLRKLQAGGHRALIFTQMTKVLDILEQFLNIHGHKYLRLDGATKVEQRQILTDRFNHDPRILCFILSTRSGGLGINLTGADTVIFYDQDWNPAMDKQCQDRCHRIGQTRDVHIYRLVSEHTIEANILRKASQKQMLDDVVIQEGEFTTDYFNKIAIRDIVGNNGEISANENDVVANAAMDRVLGGVESSGPRNAARVLEQAEDKEDVAAARLAEKEIMQDDADFLEQQPIGSGPGSGVSSVRQGTPREGTEPPLSASLTVGKTGQSGLGLFAESVDDLPDAAAAEAETVMELNAFGEQMQTIDDYMLSSMSRALEGTPLDLPRDKKKSKKKGKDTRKR